MTLKQSPDNLNLGNIRPLSSIVLRVMTTHSLIAIRVQVTDNGRFCADVKKLLEDTAEVMRSSAYIVSLGKAFNQVVNIQIEKN